MSELKDELESPRRNSNSPGSDKNEEADQQPELNEELYNRLMASIQKIWLNFDIDNGMIGEQDFKTIMV